MSFTQIKKKQATAIAVVIIFGVLLAIVILRSAKQESPGEGHEHTATEDKASVDERPKHGESGHNHEIDHLLLNNHIEAEHGHEAQPEELMKGPHGGKLFTQNDFGLEVTIFEQNTPPEFRLYAYQDGKPLDPVSVTVTIQLTRLGAEPQQLSFAKEDGYLKSKEEVEEPHSFSVSITAKYHDKTYHFNYERIEARAKITDKQLLHNGIEVLTAGPAKIMSTLHLLGEVKLNADKSVYVVSRVGGIVDSVSANAGDTVKKGQLLASVSSQSIADIRSDLLAAEKKARLARATYAREKQLWEEKISAQQDYLQAEHDLQEANINTARIQQKLSALGANANGQTRYEIRSPIDGVITNKQISQGQVVSEVDRIFEVADLSTVWVEMSIYAKDINVVKAGQKVTVKATAFDADAVGTIAYIGALVGAKSRTAMARVVLNNENRTWLPGLPVNIALISDEVEVPLAVSVEGIQKIRDWTVVFGRYGDYFEARPLTLGLGDDRYVEVLQGLKVGEQYAAGNSFLIKADIGKAGASHDH
ncbi:MAG: efflux RND transporter periplasmic adaptor subunit [Methylophilaceae bacterium]